MVLNKQSGLQHTILLLKQFRLLALPGSLLLHIIQVQGDRQASYYNDRNMRLLPLASTLSTGSYSRQLTYSVYVVLKLSWQVQVDDMGNAFHVQPSTGHISCHQYLQAMHSS